MVTRHDFVIVGGGIVGLATAYALGTRHPDATLLLIEKEDDVAQHQTGRNSGVIHSGIYYAPGSLKARMCRAGNASITAFCDEYGLPYDRCGKVIVATRPEERAGLERLHARAVEHGLPVRRLDAGEVREIEPHVQAVAGLHLSMTGIVDYAAICRTLAGVILARGGQLRFGTEVTGVRQDTGGYQLETSAGPAAAHVLVNCAGLHSDRVARMAGADPQSQIVPFRGEYYELRPERRHLVKHLIYPVPNPDFPFLGVHFTRMIDGSVHAGPNAVLAFAREGYHKTALNLRDLGESLRYPGFQKLARKNVREGAMEMWRSLSKAAFVRSLQTLIPEVTADDIVPSKAGVRAQALTPGGQLVDDFLLVDGPSALHVCNAPSPAATSSFEIGRTIAARVPVPAHLSAAHHPGRKQGALL
ncbi:L-2-hydroxyglutarate oxidase [Deinococcus marmoris]|uniref:L-2-hydroxyglutarate oxidase n=1 Tax=Deinococcus marmoris TaxID=249408 RepID=UPI000495FF70|nr:L-2-hydroxyglutarate oxidase [Deinococcus marmoris]